MSNVVSMEEIRAIADIGFGVDLTQIDLDSIHLPPGENFGIPSDDDDLMEEDPLEFDQENLVSICLVVETQKTLGYCFIEYNTPQEADLSKEKTHGYKLDKSHIFAVNMFEDITKFIKVPDERSSGIDAECSAELVYKRPQQFTRQSAAIWGGATTFLTPHALCASSGAQRDLRSLSSMVTTPDQMSVSTLSWSGTNTGRVSKLTTLKQANTLYWSPGGRFIILAGMKGFNGRLEFFGVDELDTMASAEHFMATDVEWDPTGRYVATAVTSVHEMENGFNVWSFNVELLYRILRTISSVLLSLTARRICFVPCLSSCICCAVECSTWLCFFFPSEEYAYIHYSILINVANAALFEPAVSIGALGHHILLE
ncbi:hypothetical protein HAX54_019971 [Datura stramonium]|uniref:Translation initiation factor beta propellor-like domain-containing protein n=1 Tax=Datura stramonium TaxID=4076 RepID=A0ABS8UQ26_DATST|nr:hypothetical protein [Datura stramonium]